MVTKILHYYIASHYRKKRGHNQATAKNYAELVEAAPGNNKWRFEYALSLYKAKRYKDSLSQVGILIDKNYKLYESNILKGRIYFRQDDFDKAINVFKYLHDDNPSQYLPICLLADCYFEKGKYSDSEKYYKLSLESIKSSGDNEYISYIFHSLGRIAEIDKDLQLSGEYYRKAVETSSTKSVKKYGIAIMHMKRKWYRLAIDEFEHSLKDKKHQGDIYFQIGKCYSRLSDQETATEYYKKFIDFEADTYKSGKHLIDEKLIVFDAFMGRNYADSPKAIYESMKNNPEFSDFTFVWVFRKFKPRRHWKLFINPRTKIVRYKSRDYFRTYAEAKYWITNSRLPYITKFDDSQVYLQCWHGTPLKRLGHDVVDNYDGAKYTNEEMTLQYDNTTKALDYFVSPSKYASDKFKSAFALKKYDKEGAILEEGYPRNDRLINFTSSNAKKIKKRLGIDLNKKVLLYAPTWRDSQYSKDQGYTYKTEADFDYLYNKLGDEWVILFRAHYFIANSFNFSKYDGFIKDVSKIDDVNDLYIISDVLMTDYSSVFFDYANLHRPMIFFMYDLDYYKDKLRGFYIDLSELPGDIVKEEQEIVDILNDLDGYTDKHKNNYRKFNSKFNYLDDGKASERIIKRVLDI